MSLNDLYGNTVRDGRRNLSEKRVLSDSLQNLHQKNHQILNLHAMGLKDEQISKSVGVSVQAVRKTTNSDLGREKLKIMRGAADASVVEVQDKIASMQMKALDVLDEILEDEERASLSLKRTTAMNVLVDLGGHGAPKKLDVRQQHALITPEFIEELRKAGQMASEESQKHE